jgi:biotin synthase
MSDELQALAFLAGANSIFYGEKLLTTGNPDVARDRALLARLGLTPTLSAHAEVSVTESADGTAVRAPAGATRAAAHAPRP